MTVWLIALWASIHVDYAMKGSTKGQLA